MIFLLKKVRILSIIIIGGVVVIILSNIHHSPQKTCFDLGIPSNITEYYY